MNGRRNNMAQMIDTEQSRIWFSRLSETQCERLHWASLEILERVGVRLYLREALDIFKKAGADISDDNLVRLPSGMVEKALTTAPQAHRIVRSLRKPGCTPGRGAQLLWPRFGHTEYR